MRDYKAYDPRLKDGWVNARHNNVAYKWAGGGFLSTSEDLVRFGESYLSAELLQPETIELLWTSMETDSGEATNYGIGWSIGTDDEGRRFVGHTGGSVGGTTFLRIYPEEELVVAVIANVTKAPYDGLPVAIADTFLQLEPALD